MEESDGALLLFIDERLVESNARVVVDADVDELPVDAPCLCLPGAIAGDAVPDPIEAAELFDVDRRRAAMACSTISEPMAHDIRCGRKLRSVSPASPPAR